MDYNTLDPKDGQQEETQEQASEATQATEEKAEGQDDDEGKGDLVD